MLTGAIYFALLSALASAATHVRTYSTIEPDVKDIEIAADTALTDHTTSNVSGRCFDRFVIIWLENTNQDTAANDPHFKYLAGKGITLTNYWSLTHPSEPNYIAAVGGDYFGLNNDNFVRLPKNVSTVVDLLDEKNISWGEYQQHMPYSGYQGVSFSNQDTHANDYVRKHNPLITYDSITDDPSRLAKIKNFTEFEIDLKGQTLPQWMFITPNMTNDGHDSNFQTASSWTRSFLDPLLENAYFNNKTAILVTFDESETYKDKNKVLALLLGGAIDSSKYNTTDDTYYTHYSEISTIEDNWDLYNLGRYDSNGDGNANVFKIVANVTGYENKLVDTSNQFFNQSVLSYFDDTNKYLPLVNCSANGVTGRGVLPTIKKIWCSASTNSSKNFSSFTSTILNSSIKKGISASTTALRILVLLPLFLILFV